MNPQDQLVNLQAEQAVLGAALMDGSAFVEIAAIAQAQDFHLERHRWIYEAMMTVHQDGATPDFVTVADELKQKKHLASMGGAATLTNLLTVPPNAAQCTQYAKIVNRLATLRRLMLVAGKIAETAYNAGENGGLDHVFDKVQQLVSSVTPMATDQSIMEWEASLNSVYERQYDRLERIAEEKKGQAKPRAFFPWDALSPYAPYLKRGMFGVVAAQTAVGKTTFLECCAEAWARLGLWVAFFHFELSHEFMVDRRTVRLSGEKLHTIENGELTDKVAATTEQARGWDAGITYVHCPGWSAHQVTRAIRLLNRRGRCDVAIVDYVQLMPLLSSRGLNSAQARGQQVQTIKNTVERLGVPTMAASQFNKQAMKRGYKVMDDIRDSGEIAERANLVITLDRERLDSDQRGPQGRIIAKEGSLSPTVNGRVDKNTAGPTGPFNLTMVGHRYLMKDPNEGEPRD